MLRINPRKHIFFLKNKKKFASIFFLGLFIFSLSNVTRSVLADSNELGQGSAAKYLFSAISTGEQHSCVITETGGAKCWGSNNYGQIGDGTAVDKLTPTDVVGLNSGVTAISAGAYHTCALLATGAVKCWGYNNYGHVGDGTITDVSTPTDVVGLNSGVTAISAGRFHTCALLATGAAKCWGFSQYGRLGDGTTISKLTPTDVVGLSSGVTAISAGSDHTCALLATGAAKCWGGNQDGELGDNTAPNWKSTPTDIVGLNSGVTAISAGSDYTCALLATGAMKCWGRNGSGQIGDGTTINKSTPTDVAGLSSGVTAISIGGEYNNSDSQSCALLNTGAMKCWGLNNYGQIGDGTTTNSSTPTDVAGLSSGVTAISVGGSHTCAIDIDLYLQCWGRNSSGQLGINSIDSKVVPNDVIGLSGIPTQVVAGTDHTCLLRKAKRMKCWGLNSSGRLGDGTTIRKSIPTDVVGLNSGVSAISTSASHTCALVNTGAVKCWGYNYNGQLGDGTTTHRSIPTDVVGLNSGVTAISAGGDLTCALVNTGAVKCWGRNSAGQLGDGTTTNSSTPTDVVGLNSGVTAISAGASHTCALVNTGAVKCWGYNHYGQLGDGTTTNSSTPTDVVGLNSGVTAIIAGELRSCALVNTGAMKCWGLNNYGQIGDGTTTNSSTPTDVVGLNSGVTAMSAGGSHTCAVINTGTVNCWGYNSSGQIGNGTFVASPSPTSVSGYIQTFTLRIGVTPTTSTTSTTSTVQPSTSPTVQPSTSPTVQPSTSPTVQPSTSPTVPLSTAINPKFFFVRNQLITTNSILARFRIAKIRGSIITLAVNNADKKICNGLFNLVAKKAGVCRITITQKAKSGKTARNNIRLILEKS